MSVHMDELTKLVIEQSKRVSSMILQEVGLPNALRHMASTPGDAQVVDLRQGLLYIAGVDPAPKQATILCSQVNDPNSWDVPEQAHMMSAPTRKHISDAAFDEYAKTGGSERSSFERWHSLRGLVLLTVAEHEVMEARLLTASQANDALREQRDELRADVERLKRANIATEDAYMELRGALNEATNEIERLRKERDATVDTKPIRQETGMAQTLMRASRAGAADLVLDPRLGTPQPDGEPVEPMSQRKPYRWGMV